MMTEKSFMEFVRFAPAADLHKEAKNLHDLLKQQGNVRTPMTDLARYRLAVLRRNLSAE